MAVKTHTPANSATTHPSFTIGGIQQIGIGLSNLDHQWQMWNGVFGFDCQVLRESGSAELMRHYTNSIAEHRDAMIALNLHGGGGLELWQYTSRVPQPAHTIPLPGDYGIFALKLKTPSAARARQYLIDSTSFTVSDILHDSTGATYCMCEDNEHNIIQLIERDTPLGYSRHPIGGVEGAIIGCSNLARSQQFYRDVLGFEQVCSQATIDIADNAVLTQRIEPYTAQAMRLQSVILKKSDPGNTPFATLYGNATVELWALDQHTISAHHHRPSQHIFHNRQWGDLGYIHLCLEVTGLDAISDYLTECGYPVSVDSGTFSMGEGGGRFAYVEDPDGTLIELVETHSLRVLKKPPLTLNVKNRMRPLPKLLLRALALKRNTIHYKAH